MAYGRRSSGVRWGDGLICLLMLGLLCQAADPVVSNVTVAQQPGTKQVAIGYDLAADGPVGVAIQISADDGVSWNIPAASLSGDVGGDIAPGTGKSVTWDMAADWPGRRTTQLRVEIVAGVLHTVVFDLGAYGQRTGGGELTQRVMHGRAAQGPDLTVMFGWTFVGWDADYTAISGDLTVFAQYAEVPRESALYVVLDLSGGVEATTYPVSYHAALLDGGSLHDYKTTKLVLRRIPAGTFVMGSPASEVGRWDSEVLHSVTLSKDYHLGVFEVTQKQWNLVMGSWPSQHDEISLRDVRPVEMVSWNEVRGGTWPGSPAGTGEPGAASFVQRLRERTGIEVDLPTEAQWEYACRAGTTTALNSGRNLTDSEMCPNLSEVARYAYNGGRAVVAGVEAKGSAPVGRYLPNVWGFYDMHGNCAEFCLDFWGVLSGAEVDPTGPATGTIRSLRGGGWWSVAGNCRSALRGNSALDYRNPNYGFRLCVPGRRSVRFDLGAHGVRTGGGALAQMVYPGHAATEPTLDVAPGWMFTGWSMDVAAITEDATIVAQYAEDAGYLVVDLSAGPTATSYPVARLATAPAGGWTADHRTNQLVLRCLPPGTFFMGSPADELGRNAADETRHAVTLTQACCAGIFEVTQKQWERVMGAWPSFFGNVDVRDGRPVEKVSWGKIRGGSWPGSPAGAGQPAAGTFVQRLRERTGIAFDLPTEAQWEYACRAGTTTALNSGANLTAWEVCPNMAVVGRYRHNHPGGYSGTTGVGLEGGTATVGSYLPNAWGLYDMHGNVFEWCLDYYGAYPDAGVDDLGPETGEKRVFRGGSWDHNAFFQRAARRASQSQSATYSLFGFRLFAPAIAE